CRVPPGHEASSIRWQRRTNSLGSWNGRRTGSMATQIQTARQLRVVRCRVGDEVYALDLRGVRGIHRSDGMRRERGLDGRTGYIPAQAGNVPVFALAEILGPPVTPPHVSQHLALLKSQG